VKTVAVLEDDRCNHDHEEDSHSSEEPAA
jgi:hypothetical protein